MLKPFQNSLLLCVKKYSLYNNFYDLLNELSSKVYGIDIREKINPFYLKLDPQIRKLPFRLRKYWDMFFLTKINSLLMDFIQKQKPDLVFVYNSEFLLPETCIEIKKRARLVFFMGDSPFYTPMNPYYLTCLTYADLILSPDTFWISQLHMLGIDKTSFFVTGIDSSSYNVINDENELAEIENPDILYVGASYVNTWGYKKALLMSKFTGLDLKIYGNRAWKRWFRFFPELEPVFTETGYIPTVRLNKMFNKAKMIPVDGNPAILNGYHIRIFEVLGSGSLPLIEDRKDIKDSIFKGYNSHLPLIKDYSKAGDLARYYLKNDKERKQLITDLREFILERFNTRTNAELVLSALKKSTH